MGLCGNLNTILLSKQQIETQSMFIELKNKDFCKILPAMVKEAVMAEFNSHQVIMVIERG